MRILLASFLVMGACASKSDGAPPSSPEPEAAAEPEVAAEPEAAEKPEPEKPAPEPEKPAAGDILAVVAAQAKAGTFNELLALSDAARGLHSMDGAGFTLLVPTDEAFARLPKGTIERLKKNTAELDRVIKYHMVLGTNDVGKLANYRTAPTAEGRELEVKTSSDEMLIQGARLVETDIRAANGYVHLIDKVLLPKK